MLNKLSDSAVQKMTQLNYISYQCHNFFQAMQNMKYCGHALFKFNASTPNLSLLEPVSALSLLLEQERHQASCAIKFIYGNPALPRVTSKKLAS